jgi:hypothetical protein
MQGMPRIDKKWMRAIGAALLLVAALAAVTTIFAGRSGQADVVRRTPTPSFTPTPSNTPTDTDTPTSTNTPTFTKTPTFTPTPQTPKDREDLFETVIIGGSTGFDYLGPGTSYVPLFDGGVSRLSPIRHVTLPGAITHLEVQLDHALNPDEGFSFHISVNGIKSDVRCGIPSKKGDFCADGDKDSHCVEVGPQDLIAVQAVTQGRVGGLYRMSWVAKLDLYGSCPN